ncbi:MAG: AmpG family muropeptide MFS transporter, partial [Bdellovibrio sp. CG10_big_fil_rev_8_21_14_0_10_47_8]
MSKQMLVILMMGISSGLPLALTGGTLQAWMKSDGIDLTTIGLFAAVGLPSALKFLWAPLMDRFTLFRMGRRRSWMLVTQILLIFSILGMGSIHPKEQLWTMAFFALLVSFFSASQDIVLDAWRREALPNEQLGFGSSVHVTGYLFAFRLISGALALILSEHMSWSAVYTIMAAVAGLGVIATFLAHEPKLEVLAPRTFRESVFDPFVDYFAKPGAILILVFILLYKVGDNMASQMSIPFYLDLGFSRTEVGAISKIVGWVSLATGGLVGGALMLRIRLLSALTLFGILQAISTFGLAILAQVGYDLPTLTGVIAFENFTSGMGTAAFVAFMATITSKKFTATQYALLTSFMAVPRTLLVTPTGKMAEVMGWFGFFTFCTLIAIPGLIMIFFM